VGGIAYGSGGVEQKESPDLMTIRRRNGLYANDYVNHVESRGAGSKRDSHPPAAESERAVGWNRIGHSQTEEIFSRRCSAPLVRSKRNPDAKTDSFSGS
jgi:hypothetical protein